jgi:hypothetical protein
VFDWLEFGRGPLFRFAFALMLLGLLRLVALALLRARNKNDSGMELPPARPAPPVQPGALWTAARLILLVVFHTGLIALPLFVAAHVFAWRRAVGFAWFALPKEVSDWLAVATVAAGAALFLMSSIDLARGVIPGRRPIWVLVLLVPVATGYLAANFAFQPESYRFLMLLHVYSGNFILAVIPFTRVADCVLQPLTRSVVRSPWRPLAEILALSVSFRPRPASVNPAASGEEG